MTLTMIETEPNPHTESVEQAELDRVLASEAFRRAPTLARILEYLCNRQLRGETFIKEYEIATQVMGRSRDFDPQQDGSVRVNLHHLRKKLKSFYEAEGATHAVRISLPIGQSLPSFVAQQPHGNDAEPLRKEAELPAPEWERSATENVSEPPGAQEETSAAILNATAVEVEPVAEIGPTPETNRLHSISFAAALLGSALTAAVLACLLTWFFLRPTVAKAPSAVISDATLRLACGATHSFQDSAGRTWNADASFHGGTVFHRTVAAIDGAPDSRVYSNGREGDFTYDLPLPRASYELHLYFAETAVHGEGFRTMGIWVNGKRMEQMFDVTSDAGGFASATERIYTAVEPAADGKLHLRFQGVTASAFVNAIEVMPGNGETMRPIRETTLPTYYFDPQGTVWAPDAWFHGGRVSQVSALFPALRLPGFYGNERFGNFSYSIPVLPNRTYSLTLYFQDAWFSHQTGQPVNAGQRRFDVICNGQVLLRQFDVLQEAGRDPAAGANSFRVTRHFSGIQPTTSGKILLAFTPSQNYAVLNALAIEQEPGPAASK